MNEYALIYCFNARKLLKQNKYDRILMNIQKNVYLCGKSK
jgi:hypothetical protein